MTVGKAMFPAELIQEVLQYLNVKDDLVTIICFSLASRQYYDCVSKCFRPDDPDDRRATFYKDRFFFRGRDWTWGLKLSQKIELAPLLKDWVWEKYRPASPATIEILHYSGHIAYATSVIFLSREAYGDTFKQELALPQRYLDFKNMSCPFEYNKLFYTPYLSPPKHNQGDDWYKSMANDILWGYIVPHWDRPSKYEISAWFDPDKIRTRNELGYNVHDEIISRQEFWTEYMHSSLRAWVHHTGDRFEGKGSVSEFSGEYDGHGSNEGNLHKGYDSRSINPNPNFGNDWQWTYNGRDSFHRGICYLENVSIKDKLKAIERDIDETWCVVF